MGSMAAARPMKITMIQSKIAYMMFPKVRVQRTR